MRSYEEARERYAALGTDTEEAIRRLSDIKISMHCWQGDDVKGFLFRDRELSGGIQATGNYPGAARTPDELRADMDEAFSLIGGKHKVNLHSTYADTDEKIDLDAIEPRHYASWVQWAKERGLGVDSNPTCRSHEKAETGYTLSSADETIRSFWVEHCRRSRRVGEYFGKELGQKCVTNIWVPDGSKDVPVDRYSPRLRLKQSLDEIFAERLDPAANLDAVESKLFGIGSESYVVGSHEFYMGYAMKNGVAVCLDAGHFHPTEVISNKISSLLLFSNEMLLHVSRPVRWDSDHVVILDDELQEIAFEVVRNGLLPRIHIGLDFFDASIDRVAATAIGARAAKKCLLMALLEPRELMAEAERNGNFAKRLASIEAAKMLPFGLVWEMYCEKNNVPGESWFRQI